MPDNPTPFKLPEGFKFEVGAVLPGEAAIVAVFEYAGVVRQTTSQENRDELDRLNIKFYKAWLKMFGIE